MAALLADCLSPLTRPLSLLLFSCCLLGLLPFDAAAQRIIPQQDTRRFISGGEVSGTYEDKYGQADIEGTAGELTFYHYLGEWSITRSLTLGYYDLSGIYKTDDGSEGTVDYERAAIGGTLGLGLDVGPLSFYPQFMFGVGTGSFSKDAVINGVERSYPNNQSGILMQGAEFIVTLDILSDFFVGVKVGTYTDVARVYYASDVGEIRMSNTALISIGYRSRREFIFYNRGILNPY
jgi:hypothetical protein